ncbi:MAG: mnmE 3 [Planctomycetaceae bacterium]|nr:mnmE 3 [Planctomycetaceae bacterium]
MSIKTQWILLLAWLSVPFVLLGIAGSMWLWEHHWTFYYAAIVALVTGVSWPLLRFVQKNCTRPLEKLSDEPDPNWPPRATQAYADIEALASRVDADTIPLDQPEVLFKLMREVLEVVAKRYFPDSDNPVLETPIPHVLKIVELVSFDLREAFSTHVPGSHILTLNDALRLHRLSEWFPTINRLYRVAYLAVNPAAALARELAGYMQGKAINASARETKQWAVQYAIRRAGYYAIQLYSGQLVLDGVHFRQPTSSTKQILEQVEQRETALDEDPLRMLVIGQVKAGKSSLINALFGETRSAVDVVPCTIGIEPHLLERDGLQSALIFDSAGYADVESAGKALVAARDQILKCDVILLVCSSQTAAREPDRRLLAEVRQIFQDDPDKSFPAFLVVLTHIDQLRPFREWTPPYDIERPQNPKAQQIREAADAISEDLQIPIEQVIPVCLAPDQTYNVDEALVPAIIEALPEAQRSRYLRAMREHRDDAYWSQLWEQSRNAGRVVAKLGIHALHQAGRKLDELGQKISKRP